jgi:spore germination cell wall hydrolase CwlJ-like protein
MKFSTGAGGFAAAMLLLFLGTFNPTPSHAWELNVPNVVPPAPAAAAPAEPAAIPAPVPTLSAPQASAPASPPAAAATADSASALDQAEHHCLATAVYFEAKGEPTRGQFAVAQVILNRIHSGRFPSSVCGVVKQRGQFSFVRGGRLPAAPHGSAAWQKAMGIARKVLDGSAERVAANALFFHARGVSTGWHAVRVAQIGNHLFYR